MKPYNKSAAIKFWTNFNQALLNKLIDYKNLND